MTPASSNPWLIAARPRTLGAAVAPVIMGIGLALREGGFHAPSAALAFLGALLLQVGANYCNDWADFVKGADTGERVGPTRATAAGLVTPRQMRNAALLVFALAGVVALLLVLRAGWPVAAIGAASIAAGILYTAGPWPLAYLGLGEVFVLVFFGPVAVAGTHYVQTLRFSADAAIAGVAAGALATGILVVNNLRDVETDRKAGKRTLAVRFGAGFARAEYAFCVALAAAVPALLFARGGWTPVVLAVPAVLLLGFPVFRRVASARGADLNPGLGETGLLLVRFAAIFTAVCAYEAYANSVP
jgi:1,4-dihydroxy-2-naphthoate octaprenyltransferase